MKQLIFVCVLLTIGSPSFADKVQEIDFEDLQVEGKSINPDGFFLVQRPGIEFKPLIEIKADLDRKIRKSHRRVQQGI